MQTQSHQMHLRARQTTAIPNFHTRRRVILISLVNHLTTIDITGEWIRSVMMYQVKGLRPVMACQTFQIFDSKNGQINISIIIITTISNKKMVYLYLLRQIMWVRNYCDQYLVLMWVKWKSYQLMWKPSMFLIFIMLIYRYLYLLCRA